MKKTCHLTRGTIIFEPPTSPDFNLLDRFLSSVSWRHSTTRPLVDASCCADISRQLWRDSKRTLTCASFWPVGAAAWSCACSKTETSSNISRNRFVCCCVCHARVPLHFLYVGFGALHVLCVGFGALGQNSQLFCIEIPFQVFRVRGQNSQLFCADIRWSSRCAQSKCSTKSEESVLLDFTTRPAKSASTRIRLNPLSS